MAKRQLRNSERMAIAKAEMAYQNRPASDYRRLPFAAEPPPQFDIGVPQLPLPQVAGNDPATSSPVISSITQDLPEASNSPHLDKLLSAYKQQASGIPPQGMWDGLKESLGNLASSRSGIDDVLNSWSTPRQQPNPAAWGKKTNTPQTAPTLPGLTGIDLVDSGPISPRDTDFQPWPVGPRVQPSAIFSSLPKAVQDVPSVHPSADQVQSPDTAPSQEPGPTPGPSAEAAAGLARNSRLQSVLDSLKSVNAGAMQGPVPADAPLRGNAAARMMGANDRIGAAQSLQAGAPSMAARQVRGGHAPFTVSDDAVRRHEWLAGPEAEALRTQGVGSPTGLNEGNLDDRAGAAMARLQERQDARPGGVQTVPIDQAKFKAAEALRSSVQKQRAMNVLNRVSRHGLPRPVAQDIAFSNFIRQNPQILQQLMEQNGLNSRAAMQMGHLDRATAAQERIAAQQSADHRFAATAEKPSEAEGRRAQIANLNDPVKQALGVDPAAMPYLQQTIDALKTARGTPGQPGGIASLPPRPQGMDTNAAIERLFEESSAGAMTPQQFSDKAKQLGLAPVHLKQWAAENRGVFAGATEEGIMGAGGGLMVPGVPRKPEARGNPFFPKWSAQNNKTHERLKLIRDAFGA